MAWFNKKEKKSKIKYVKQHIRWFEIPANDFSRATAFYSKVFGMEINEIELNGIKHGIFKFGEGQVKGAIVDNGSAEIKNGIVLFFDGYPSLGDVEAKIIANGGQILVSKTLIKDIKEDGSSVIPKNFIDGSILGYYAYFLDSEGNRMGLYGNS
ncbi:MAG: hypothetical protein COA97_12970 [Flavobacteriales bacterium]|nr:MAG: hypothetical protein COA97_12970 [Flavobacteriales bacterium]